MVLRPLVTSIGAALTVTALSASAAAADDDVQDQPSDHYSVVARGETLFQLYERALLPGPDGALVVSRRVAPINQYLSLRVQDIDAIGHKDSLDVELSAWGGVHLGELDNGDGVAREHRLDGDVQSANVRYHQGQTWLRLGRQAFAGGAARYARFDGLAVGSRLDVGLGAEAYGGLSVLPRWNQQIGYQQLGSAQDTLLRNPDALEDPNRTGYWLAGARLFYDKGPLSAGASFHEQHENSELAHRNVGADAHWQPSDKLAVGGNGIFDLDGSRLADARAWVDATPHYLVDLTGEFTHTVPAAFLSHQSVLSVFSTDSFDEVGGGFTLHAMPRLALEGNGFIELFSDGERGSRGDAEVRWSPDRPERTMIIVAYGRVIAPENGYHSLRTSLRRRIVRPLTATAEAYLYFYDESIRGIDTSSVYAGTLGYAVLPELSVLWGASVARSPYAKSDVQSLVRLSYLFGGRGGT
ncbi:MAG: hypothetical protein KC776_17985 [Myxococcales bacterium]|nr:hypothetical protein [Myxococcales bacterium]MCB9575436.1 hypothetical protein [Polyangiaceae bacterium]